LCSRCGDAANWPSEFNLPSLPSRGVFLFWLGQRRDVADRVHRGLPQLARRLLLFQEDSQTNGVKGARARYENDRRARKLLIALWRMVTIGEIPHRVDWSLSFRLGGKKLTL
jgi:hypothetical protein